MSHEPPTAAEQRVFGVDAERCPQTGRIFERGSGALSNEEQTLNFLHEAKHGKASGSAQVAESDEVAFAVPAVDGSRYGLDQIEADRVAVDFTRFRAMRPKMTIDEEIAWRRRQPREGANALALDILEGRTLDGSGSDRTRLLKLVAAADRAGAALN